MTRTGCYTPDGQHRMNGDACTVCLRGMAAPSLPTLAPGPASVRRPSIPAMPSVPPTVPAPPAPRRRRPGRALAKFVLIVALVFGTFIWIGYAHGEQPSGKQFMEQYDRGPGH